MPTSYTKDQYAECRMPVSGELREMAQLSRNHYQALLTAVERLHACNLVSEFPLAALHAAGQLVPSDRISFEHIAPTVPEMWGIADPPMEYTPEQRQVFIENIEQQPLINFYYRTGNPSPHKISDFLSEKAWRRTLLYQKLFRPLGYEDQMAFALTPPDREFYGLVFYRGQRNFTECDRAVLDLFRPHVKQCFENLRVLDRTRRLQQQQEDALRDNGRFLIWIDPKGRIIEASPEAMGQLHEFFPESANRLNLIPETLQRWLRETVPRKGSGRLPTKKPFLRNRGHGRLVIRCFQVEDDPVAGMSGRDRLICLLLEIHNVPVRRSRLETFGLSQREIQVFHQLELGKTNTEIAARLSISPLTAKKHLENIFNKLNVTSRAGAVGKIRSNEDAHS